jgi:hypothetical protein
MLPLRGDFEPSRNFETPQPRPAAMNRPQLLFVFTFATVAFTGCLNLQDIRKCSDPLADKNNCQPDVDVNRPGTGGNGRPPNQNPDSPVASGGAGGNSGTGPESPATGTGCDPGFHKCDGVCKDSKQTTNCGFACDPCPEIQGGMATCDGTRCGIQCPAGQKPCDDKCIAMDAPCGGCPAEKNACNGICVAATDKTACGPSCTVCPTSPNGTTTCDGECKLECNPGYHLCGDQCLPDDKVESCGKSCTACTKPTGGDVACVSGTCTPSCPGGQTLCPSTGACLPPNQPCDKTCPAGKHICNNLCVSDTEVNSCGTSCTACTAPANADPICGDAKTCSFKCRTGFHACGDACKPDNSPGSCGTSCNACPGATGGSATCSNGACGIQCNEGFHKCNGECKGNSDANACGNSCTVCPANGGRATCNNGSCGVDCQGGQNCNGKCIGAKDPCGNTCPGGLLKCGSQCVQGTCCDNGDCANGFACTNNQCSTSQCAQAGQITCGGKCITCTDAANGKSGCVNGQCALTGCNSGYYQCEGRCVQNGQRCGNSCGDGFKTCGSGCITNSQCCTNGTQGCPGPTCSGDSRTIYTCSGGQCTSSNESCNGAGCSGTNCSAKRGNNQACSSAGQCESGNCVANQKCCAAGQNLCNGSCNSGACCGNGKTEAGETCDGNCPTASSCVTNGCAVRQFSGSASSCNARCESANQTQCKSGDNCCPSGCNPGNDTECKCPDGQEFIQGACRERCTASETKCLSGKRIRECKNGVLVESSCPSDNPVCVRYPDPSCENAQCGTPHRINTGCCDSTDCFTGFCFNQKCKVRNGDTCFQDSDCVSPQTCVDVGGNGTKVCSI